MKKALCSSVSTVLFCAFLTGKVYAQPPVMGSFYPYTIVKATGDTPQAANKPTNVLDGDFNTRWSARYVDNTTPPALTLDLGDEFDVNAVQIAWHEGATRLSFVAIQAMIDGIGFLDIGGGTNFYSADLQDYPTSFVRTRFIRIQGFGNDNPRLKTSEWTSITEVRVGYDTKGLTEGPLCQ